MPNEIYNSLFTYSRLPQIEGETATELDYINPNPNLESQLQGMRHHRDALYDRVSQFKSAYNSIMLTRYFKI